MTPLHDLARLMLGRIVLLEWQFHASPQLPWRYVEFDRDYSAYIYWFGFAFWQFRCAENPK
jgi:hypothetical protein